MNDDFNNTGGIYEIDLTQIVYDKLVENLKMLRIDQQSIFQHHIPEASLPNEHSEGNPALIRISFLNQTPYQYADNIQLSWDCSVQVDVWDEYEASNIANKINFLMKQLGFKQDSPIIEYDPDTFMLRDGRQYTGIIEADKQAIAEQLAQDTKQLNKKR